MKGIIRAGGLGTRLYPSTKAVNKQLIPVYDKPAVYYSISLLMMAGITEIQIASAPRYLQAYQELLGDGSGFGISISYQAENGTVSFPDALLEGRDHIGTQSVAVALGDNVFIGETLCQRMQDAVKRFQKTKGAVVFSKTVADPREYGVLEFDGSGSIRSLESKPQNPRGNDAVTGLFFFDANVIEIIEKAKAVAGPSFTLADLLRIYLGEGRLHCERLDESIQWYDMGTPERLYLACSAVRDFQRRNGSFAGSVEEIAFDSGLIDQKQLLALSAGMGNTEYGKYLAGRASAIRPELGTIAK